MTRSGAVYELRTCYANPGKMADLHKRFKDHTLKMFEKHGMKNIAYWSPNDKADEVLIYVIEHKSREAAEKSWAAFKADPEWQAPEVAQNGPLVKADSVYDGDRILADEVTARFISPTAGEQSRTQAAPPTLEWVGGVSGVLRLLDQTLLPGVVRTIDCTSVDAVWEAIRALRVRGAPAIGVAAAYGVVIGLQGCATNDRAGFDQRLEEVCAKLATSRPTAVNLFWSLERMTNCARRCAELASAERLQRLLAEAQLIEGRPGDVWRSDIRRGARRCEGVLRAAAREDSRRRGRQHSR
jgi:hypothetical protein